MIEENHLTTIVELPDHVDQNRQNRTVSIDHCIVNQIKAVWYKGYSTLGCCCEHNNTKFDVGRPTLIIPAYYTQEQANAIYAILEDSEHVRYKRSIYNKRRYWILKQWQLSDITDEGELITIKEIK